MRKKHVQKTSAMIKNAVSWLVVGLFFFSAFRKQEGSSSPCNPPTNSHALKKPSPSHAFTCTLLHPWSDLQALDPTCLLVAMKGWHWFYSLTSLMLCVLSSFFILYMYHLTIIYLYSIVLHVKNPPLFLFLINMPNTNPLYNLYVFTTFVCTCLAFIASL